MRFLRVSAQQVTPGPLPCLQNLSLERKRIDLVSAGFVTLASLARTNDALTSAIGQDETTRFGEPPAFEWVVDIATRRVVRRPLPSETAGPGLPSSPYRRVS